MLDPSAVEIIDCDVLCIGGGAAGATAAVTAAQEGAEVVLVDKNFSGYGNTRIAGGIVAGRADAGDDDAGLFVEDILRGGGYINDPGLVRTLVEDLPSAIETVERWGHRFLRSVESPPGRKMIRVGGHSAARTLLSPHLGRSLSHVLQAALLSSTVRVFEETAVLKLICRDRAVSGALCYRLNRASAIAVQAKTVILAGGGAGMLYFPHTDNVKSACGDCYALALEAGAELIDMELFQYLPFALVQPPDFTGIAVGDPANAGPRGLLLDGGGNLLADNVYLKTRNEVSRLITGAAGARHGNRRRAAILDLRANRRHPQGELAFQVSREMGMYEVLKKAYGSGAAEWREVFEVYPTVHFTLGGVRVDSNGLSSIGNLYAAGEAAGGLHGADRLGSVALAECLVFGMRAARHACAGAGRSPGGREFSSAVSEEYAALLSTAGRAGIKAAPNSLKRDLSLVMNEKVGTERNKEDLLEALFFVRRAREQFSFSAFPAKGYDPQVLHDLEYWAMLNTAEAVILCAVERRESIGMHNRTDALKDSGPEQAPRSTLVRKNDQETYRAGSLGREGDSFAG